jgi:hypothetical protein
MCRRTLVSHGGGSNDTTIVRHSTEDPRMAGCVVYNGIVYTSGQVDMTAQDGMHVSSLEQ